MHHMVLHEPMTPSRSERVNHFLLRKVQISNLYHGKRDVESHREEPFALIAYCSSPQPFLDYSFMYAPTLGLYSFETSSMQK